MRDKGPRRSFTVRRRVFVSLAVLVCCLPLLLGGAIWLTIGLWSENRQLRDDVIRIETELHNAQAVAERLENMEELLHDSATGNDALVRRLAGAKDAEQAEPPREVPEVVEGEAPASEEPPASEAVSEPGVPAFVEVDTGFVKVENVQIRSLRGGKLRIALDLRNPDIQKIASGKVQATMVRADGTQRKIEFVPDDLGEFRISRFKRTVIPAFLPGEPDLVNAQVIIEVLSPDGTTTYRNIFPIER
jgi:hypothetical protein